ncbi:MAG: acyl-CoA dehydratase activase [Deferribacteraceae bacterium]|jgi:predicted CoA-substrate-specific enzyme activase|nr:acyl-CoA dehydratase activase [Deferribacteraceae bacterium]
MINLTLDLGSRFVKIAVQQGDTVTFTRKDTINFYKHNIDRTDDGKIAVNLDFLGVDTQSATILTTGYGRNLLQFSNTTAISEIKAHFHGAKSQTKEDNFTLVDIGGQDSKVIQVTDGYINDFTMNDKCAASTGRFIEQAANILDIPLSEFMECAESPVALSDTCAVFCESELIGKLAGGATDRSLAAGVNLSVARRLAPAIDRYSPTKIYASGGAAQSSALLHFLSELTTVNVEPLPDTQYNGVIGLLAYINLQGL